MTVRKVSPYRHTSPASTVSQSGKVRVHQGLGRKFCPIFYGMVPKCKSSNREKFLIILKGGIFRTSVDLGGRKNARVIDSTRSNFDQRQKLTVNNTQRRQNCLKEKIFYFFIFILQNILTYKSNNLQLLFRFTFSPVSQK